MTLILVIIRVLVVLMVVRLIVRFFTGRRAPAAKRPTGPMTRTGGTLVRDPQCGTYVPESRAITVGSGPGALHFCSTRCRDAYDTAGAPMKNVTPPQASRTHDPKLRTQDSH